jgi:EpsI family protein
MTRKRGELGLPWAVGLGVVLLLSAGGAHRWLSGILRRTPSTRVVLEPPLSSLPLVVGSWEGIDISIDDRVLDVAGADDYVNRRYVDRGSGQVVNLYVAYTSRPAKMLGHRPDVCYPANGWTHTTTEEDRVLLPDGQLLACLIHYFHRGEGESEGLVVLNYYMLEGKRTTQWSDFWGPQWRLPNLSRNPSYYVAQVQISSSVAPASLFERGEATVKNFAREVADEVDSLLPTTAQ